MINMSNFIVVYDEQMRKKLKDMNLVEFHIEKINGIEKYYFVNDPRKLQRINFSKGERIVYTNKLDF